MNLLKCARASRLMPSTRRWPVAACAVALLAGTSVAEAQVLLPAATGTFNYDVSLNVGVPASHTFDCGTVSISGLPQPVVSATGGACSQPLQTIFTYYFEVVGATNALVPINVSSAAALSATGAAQATYSLSVAGQDIGGGNCYFLNLAACGATSTSTSMSLMSNQAYFVRMMASVSNFLGAGSGSAVVDPVFSVDAAMSNDFSFAFSPGIGNGPTAAVPEAQTLELMPSGLALVAAFVGLRRRRGLGIASRRHT